MKDFLALLLSLVAAPTPLAVRDVSVVPVAGEVSILSTESSGNGCPFVDVDFITYPTVSRIPIRSRCVCLPTRVFRFRYKD